jgi:hypothetical protein
MTEAASTCETSVNVYQTTQHNNPETSQIHTCRRESLSYGDYNYNSMIAGSSLGSRILTIIATKNIHKQLLAYLMLTGWRPN